MDELSPRGVPHPSTNPRPESNSNRARLQRTIAAIVSEAPRKSQWRNGEFEPDLSLLGRVLGLSDPADVRGASVATALDMWVAEQFRRAGFEYILPRSSWPYYVGSSASFLLDKGVFADLDANLSTLQEANDALAVLASSAGDRKASMAIRRAVGQARASLRSVTANVKRTRAKLEQTTTSVLGEGRPKQVDVFMAEWDRGLELAVSTKTLALGAGKEGELLKNMPNRWEEFDGDLKNLRGRFPLAAIGALLLVSDSTISAGVLPVVADMMVKLTAPGRGWVNAYDSATVIVVRNWVAGQEGGVQVLREDELREYVPPELWSRQFFNDLIDRVLARAPIGEHRNVRRGKADSAGAPAVAYEAAAEVFASPPSTHPAAESEGE